MSHFTKTLTGAASAVALTGCISTGGVLDDMRRSFSGERDNVAVFERMTDVDVVMANAALDSALESRISGASVAWHNPDSGSQGQVTPLATFRADDGSYCRRYQEVLVVDGQRARFQDVACRKGRRYWVPVAADTKA